MSIVQCKFAIERTFPNTFITTMEGVGAAIREVIQFYTIRGKFSSVHPDLAAEGITRVEVGEEGLHFISDQQPGETLVRKASRFDILVRVEKHYM